MAWAPLHRSAAQSATLASIRARAAAEGRGRCAVFDLDGCLFDNRHRQLHILRAFASMRGASSLYRVRPEHFEDWHLERTLARAGLDAHTIDGLIEPLEAWWRRRFFSADGPAYDHAMPGACALVRDVAAADVAIVYLTGRDTSMRSGTLAALDAFGFPAPGDGARLMLKPDAATTDLAWKDAALETIRAAGRPILFMDNEPANVNLFAARHPEALVIFTATDHSPGAPPLKAGIPAIKGFLG